MRGAMWHYPIFQKSCPSVHFAIGMMNNIQINNNLTRTHNTCM